jgi:hypothetical protein
MNLSGSINLLGLSGAFIQNDANGRECIVIPIMEADLLMGRNHDKVYLTFAAWENRMGADQYGQTHCIRKEPTKEVRERLGANAPKPIIGNGKLIVPRQQQGQQTLAHMQQQQRQMAPAGMSPIITGGSVPF